MEIKTGKYKDYKFRNLLTASYKNIKQKGKGGLNKKNKTLKNVYVSNKKNHNKLLLTSLDTLTITSTFFTFTCKYMKSIERQMKFGLMDFFSDLTDVSSKIYLYIHNIIKGPRNWA